MYSLLSLSLCPVDGLCVGNKLVDVGGREPASAPATALGLRVNFNFPASRQSRGPTKGIAAPSTFSPKAKESSTESLMSLPADSAITSPTGSPRVPPRVPSPALARSFAAQQPWVLRTWMYPSSSEDRTGFQGHEIEWSPLRDFFLSPSPSRDRTAADSGQIESTMNQSLAPRITWHLGDPNLVSISSNAVLLLLLFEVPDLRAIWIGQEPQGRLVKTPLRQDREAYDPNEFPDFVVLSRQAFDANPELASAWAQDHVDPEKDDFRNWEQVAAIGVLGGKKECQDPTLDSAWVYPATRVKHHLRKLAAESPIRSHTFGFTLDGSILTLYLHTPSGLLYSSDIECTESNGHLSMFIMRLLSLDDLHLGKIASPGEPDGPPLPFPVAALPPRVPVFAHHLGDEPTMDSVEIAQTVFCSGAVLGLQTSASRVRATRMGVNGEQEYAMTVSFVEEARCDEHDRIRLLIASASPQEREGLTNFVDVHREVNFSTVPHFLNGHSDADSAALKPRAMEVAFQERCFETIWTVDSTEALIRVVLGVVKGLRSLYRMRILHRDVSSGNIMVGPDGEGVLIDYDLAVLMDGPFGDAARLERVGTFAFRARHLMEFCGSLLHQPWHDIESLVYVILLVVFLQPTGPESWGRMSEEAATVWKNWNWDEYAYDTKWVLLQRQSNRRELLKPYLGFWEGLPDLIAIVAKYCGLNLSAYMYGSVEAEEYLKSEWGSGELSHDQLVADLEKLLEEIVQTRRKRASVSPVIV
ncbi:BZ3500_MvSof-1268-A1-R1_Chr3-3g06614 [Microbotryum saponariae]|uniref:BZ3500_MvSof-1268-A1-R1_Chr3-3g06614 protein n=1 Tax=Microbotryum saponariae TaxID=289078 RepID=A0A2X0LGY0_9BASI|nr:BZ3500_MvSof-1268-A1-R1_Chr3-3g06614 [Microbotryum saponariae]SDA04581.1 BZ3501_MvSof-1269-A2-R1_Chr3-2g06301 [Microbotryum saponariae]